MGRSCQRRRWHVRGGLGWGCLFGERLALVVLVVDALTGARSTRADGLAGPAVGVHERSLGALGGGSLPRGCRARCTGNFVGAVGRGQLGLSRVPGRIRGAACALAGLVMQPVHDFDRRL